jgi:hypothetical protein
VADPAAELQASVDAAIRQGAQHLSVPALPLYDFGNRTLWIREAKDLVISTPPPNITASGSKTILRFWGPNGGVVLWRCRNVTFRGFAMDRSPPPHVQARVLDVNSTSVLLEMQPDNNPRIMVPWFSTGKGGMYSPLNYKFGAELSRVDGLPLQVGTPFKGLNLSDVQWEGTLRFRAGMPRGTQLKRGDTVVQVMWQGFNYVVANSSQCVTEDLTILSSGYIAIQEVDGEGGHIYDNVRIEPSAGRFVASTADGFHSTDVDVGPTLRHCSFSRLLDDYFNVQSSLLLVMATNDTKADSSLNSDPASAPTLLTVVHPHTNDQFVDGFTDLLYSTAEPLRRVRPGDRLRFFDPVTFERLDDVTVMEVPVQLDAGANTTLGRAADALFDVLNQPPYDFKRFQPEGYKLQHFRSSVYSVKLGRSPLPQLRKGLPVPYVVESLRTRAPRARVVDSTFSHSTGLFGRWKSSDSVIERNTFSYTHQLHLELEMIPSFYEGPVLVSNFSLKGNHFFVPKGTRVKDATAFLWRANASDVFVEGNTVRAVDEKNMKNTFLVSTVEASAARCLSDLDCNMAGVCDTATGACACDQGWTGAACARIDFAPEAAPCHGGGLCLNRTELQDEAVAYSSAFTSSWGGDVVVDDDGDWHMFAAAFQNETTLSSWLTQSRIVHAVSASGPLGPYVPRGIVLAPREPNGTFNEHGPWDETTQHNPAVQYDPLSKTYLLYYMGSNGISTKATPTKGACPSNHSFCHQRVGLATAKHPNGPWKRANGGNPILEPGPRGSWDDIFTTNPTPYIFPNGSALLIYKARSFENINTMSTGVAFAEHWSGPYTRITSEPIDLPGTCEDAGIYHSKNMGGVFRMVLHCACSYQAVWSLDGVTWNKTAPEVEWCDVGGGVVVSRRERPKWAVDRKGRVLALLTGVVPGKQIHDGDSFTMAQAVLR